MSTNEVSSKKTEAEEIKTFRFPPGTLIPQDEWLTLLENPEISPSENKSADFRDVQEGPSA